MPVYRQVQYKDQPDLAKLIKEYCEEVKLSYDQAASSQYLAAMLQQAHMFVAEEDGHVIGAISFTVRPHHFTGIVGGHKVAWFVTKEKRGKVGLKLLEIAENAARDLGAKHFYCSTPTKMVTDYLPLETEYVKELN